MQMRTNAIPAPAPLAWLPKMSNLARFQLMLLSLKLMVKRLAAGGLGRFWQLTPPFLGRQLVYNRVSHRFLRLGIGGEINSRVLAAIFLNDDYDFGKFDRCADVESFYRKVVAGGRTPLIVDCGANVGMATRYFTETYPLARVVAVEPDADNLAWARANNPGGGVEFLEAGIGSSDTRGEITNPGRENWILQVAVKEAGALEIISMNSVLAREPEASVPFIAKIDIEGFERNLFSEHTEWVDRFPVLVIELHDWMFPRTANARNFLAVISTLDRDFVFHGENVFSFSNHLI
jgi:FkbM family methyltransferase